MECRYQLFDDPTCQCQNCRELCQDDYEQRSHQKETPKYVWKVQYRVYGYPEEDTTDTYISVNEMPEWARAFREVLEEEDFELLKFVANGRKVHFTREDYR